MSDLNQTGGDNPTAVADNPATEPASPGTAAPQSGQANGAGAPAEETFFTGDPKTLPPELRKAYDNMLSDYRNKTTKLSEERKSFEAFKQKADLYDQIALNEQFVKMWNDYVKSQGGEPAGDDANVDPKFKAMEERISRAEQMAMKAEEARREAEAMALIDSFAAATGEDGKPLRPDFVQLEGMKIGESSLIQSFLDQDKTAAANPDEVVAKLERAYAAAKKFHDDIFEAGRKSGLGRAYAKLRNGSEPPSSTPNGNVFTGDPKKISVTQAMELARKGIRVE